MNNNSATHGSYPHQTIDLRESDTSTTGTTQHNDAFVSVPQADWEDGYKQDFTINELTAEQKSLVQQLIAISYPPYVAIYVVLYTGYTKFEEVLNYLTSDANGVFNHVFFEDDRKPGTCFFCGYPKEAKHFEGYEMQVLDQSSSGQLPESDNSSSKKV
eukprot:TRINITY_DN8518_c0_g1_i4.p1 TRINITY_DN8518_c0_g1~~TRINITY_DN8518_c0_g1_i4.p1  ORF type:complete len:158 (-),score=3.24 TRINITY_DN8518_c0_g1_i4:121-594(-)